MPLGWRAIDERDRLPSGRNSGCAPVQISRRNFFADSAIRNPLIAEEKKSLMCGKKWAAFAQLGRNAKGTGLPLWKWLPILRLAESASGASEPFFPPTPRPRSGRRPARPKTGGGPHSPLVRSEADDGGSAASITPALTNAIFIAHQSADNQECPTKLRCHAENDGTCAMGILERRAC